MTKAILPTNWPATQIEMWDLSKLSVYANNARVHSAEQVDRIANSIRQFGFTVPILVAEDGTIIAGHGRVMAAEQLEITEVPVMVARGWTEAQRRAYGIADNRLAENSTWDMDMLQIEIGEIIADDEFALDEIGFSSEDLESITNGTFAPELFPTTSYEQVTEENVASAEKELAQAPLSRSKQELVKILCPHCVTEFELDPKSLA